MNWILHPDKCLTESSREPTIAWWWRHHLSRSLGQMGLKCWAPIVKKGSLDPILSRSDKIPRPLSSNGSKQPKLAHKQICFLASTDLIFIWESYWLLTSFYANDLVGSTLNLAILFFNSENGCILAFIVKVFCLLDS